MIDVLLVLLIIFMAIAPQRSVGLDALVPDSRAGGDNAVENPVVLEIGADGGFRLNTVVVARANLTGRLSAIYARQPGRALFVKGAPGLEFRVVAEAIDLARDAGVDRVALMPRS